ERLWDLGQLAAQEGNLAKAVQHYRQSLTVNPALTRNHLSLAAAYLEMGQDQKACDHLGRYVAANPDHHAVRAHHGELLIRLKRTEEARSAFERFLADVEDGDELDLKHAVHCHSRLMELAEGADDDYSFYLHRGIGLYLLAKQNQDLKEGRGSLNTESLLCKAAADLTKARKERPGEARPPWHLYRVWSLLGQQQPAQQSLREAKANAPFSKLTTAEQRGLQLASPVR